MAIGDPKAWSRLFDQLHGFVHPNLSCLVIPNFNLQLHNPPIVLVVVEVSQLIVPVFKSIWKKPYRYWLASEFNALFHFLVFFSLYSHLSEIAEAFSPYFRVKFACLWDPKSRRIAEKKITLLKRQEDAIEEAALLYQDTARKRHIEELKRWKKSKQARDKLIEAGEKVPDEFPPKPESLDALKPERWLELSDVVVPTAPTRIEAHSNPLAQHAIRGYGLHDTSHYQALTDAENLYPLAVARNLTSSPNFHHLDYFTIDSNVSRDSFLPGPRYSFANVLDFDIFSLIEPSQYLHLIHKVPLSSATITKYLLPQSADPLAPPPFVPSPDKSLEPMWRSIKFGDAVNDPELFGCRTVQGRAGTHVIIGSDISPGAKDLKLDTFTSDDYEELCRFLDFAPLLPSYERLSTSQQRILDTEFRRLIEHLLRTSKCKDCTFLESLIFPLYLDLQYLQMGRSTPKRFVDKRVLYQQARDKRLAHSLYLEEIEHRQRTADILGPHVPPRNIEWLPRSKWYKSSSSNQSLPSTARPSVVSPPPRPAPLSHDDAPLSFTRQDLGPQITMTVNQRKTFINTHYFDRTPLPPSPPQVPTPKVSLKDVQMKFAADRYGLVQAFSRLHLRLDSTSSNSPTPLQPITFLPSTPVLGETPIHTNWAFLICHVATVITSLGPLAALARVTTSFLNLVGEKDPKLFRELNMSSKDYIRGTLGSIGTQMSAFTTSPVRPTKDPISVKDYKLLAAALDYSVTDDRFPRNNWGGLYDPTITSRATALDNDWQKKKDMLFVDNPTTNSILQQLLEKPSIVIPRIYETLRKRCPSTVPGLSIRPPPEITTGVSNLLSLLASDNSKTTRDLLSPLTAFLNQSSYPPWSPHSLSSFDYTSLQIDYVGLQQQLERLYVRQRPSQPSSPPKPLVTQQDYRHAVDALISIYSSLRSAIPKIALDDAFEHARTQYQKKLAAQSDVGRTPQTTRVGRTTAPPVRLGALPNDPAIVDPQLESRVQTLFPQGGSFRDLWYQAKPKDQDQSELYYKTKHGTYDLGTMHFNCTTLFRDVTRRDLETVPPLALALQELARHHNEFATRYNEELSRRQGQAATPVPLSDNSSSVTSTLLPPPTTFSQFSTEEIAARETAAQLHRVDRILNRTSSSTRDPLVLPDLLNLAPTEHVMAQQRAYPKNLVSNTLGASPLFVVSSKPVPDGGILLYEYREELGDQVMTLSSHFIGYGFGSSNLNFTDKLKELELLPSEVVNQILKLRRTGAHWPHGTYAMNLHELFAMVRLPSVLEKLPEGINDSITLIEQRAYKPDAYRHKNSTGLCSIVPVDSTNSATQLVSRPHPPLLTPSPDGSTGIWTAARNHATRSRRPLVTTESLKPQTLDFSFERDSTISSGKTFNSLPELRRYKEEQDRVYSFLRYRICSPIIAMHIRVVYGLDIGHNYPVALVAYIINSGQGFADYFRNERNRGEQISNAKVRELLKRCHPSVTLLGFLPDEETAGVARTTAEARAQLDDYLRAYQEANPSHRVSNDLNQNSLLLEQYTRRRKAASKAEKQRMISQQLESLLPRIPGYTYEVIWLDTVTNLAAGKFKRRGLATAGTYIKLYYDYFRSRFVDILFYPFAIREEYTSRTCSRCFSPNVVHPTNGRTGQVIPRITICPECDRPWHRDSNAAQLIVEAVLLAVQTGGHWPFSHVHEKEGFRWGEVILDYLFPRPNDATYQRQALARYNSMIAEQRAAVVVSHEPGVVENTPTLPRRRRAAGNEDSDSVIAEEEDEIIPPNAPYYFRDHPHRIQEPLLGGFTRTTVEEVFTVEERGDIEAYFKKFPPPKP
ncbi:hypothetical protein JCM5353_004302 [Sporobolomyces roseus]